MTKALTFNDLFNGVIHLTSFDTICIARQFEKDEITSDGELFDTSTGTYIDEALEVEIYEEWLGDAIAEIDETKEYNFCIYNGNNNKSYFIKGKIESNDIKWINDGENEYLSGTITFNMDNIVAVLSLIEWSMEHNLYSPLLVEATIYKDGKLFDEFESQVFNTYEDMILSKLVA